MKHPKIINLANIELTDTQKTVLFKGLKFAKTPKRNTFELKSDIQKFSRKLRLIEFFANTDDDEEDESFLRNPSEFFPPANRNRKLDASTNFLNSLNLDIKKKQKSNLSKEQWNAINQLKNNDGIIIKEASQRWKRSYNDQETS